MDFKRLNEQLENFLEEVNVKMPKDLNLVNVKLEKHGSYKQDQDMEIELINDGPYKVFILIQGPDVTGEDEIFCNILVCDEDLEHLPEYYVDGESTISNVLEGLKRLVDSKTIDKIIEIMKQEGIYNKETQTKDNNEVIGIITDCYNHNERIIGKLENESEYGSWNFQIKILKLNKITATILYNSQKLTPSGLWDNGIQKSQKFTKDITNHSSIEEFIQSVIRYIQGKDYKVKNWTIK